MMTELAATAGRRLWIGLPGAELDDATQRHLEQIRPGGIVLFRRNIRDLEQTRTLIARLRDLLGPTLRISVDQEGGLVVRFIRERTVFPGNMALGAVHAANREAGRRLARRQGEIMGVELADLAIDVNLAPVLDLATTGDNPGITIRSLGEDPEAVAELGRELIRGMLGGGVLPTLKHFPGKGEATLDAHLDLPVIPADRPQTPHLVPFSAAIAAGAPLVMTSHVVYRCIDPRRPATLSSEVVRGLLRRKLGFDGVVVTDDLEMGAMRKHFGFDGVIRGAVAAGHDALCIAHDLELQRRAWEILSRGLENDEEFCSDWRESDRRLLQLETPAPGVQADETHERVAREIARRAVTVVRDDSGLLPFAREAAVTVILPTLRGETLVENPLRDEEDGSVFVRALGSRVIVEGVATDPSPSEIERALAAARRTEHAVCVLTNARFLPGQRQLARRAAAEHPGAVLLAIRSPFDLEVVPADLPHTAVATYGFRADQLRAAADVLLGALEAKGRLPIRLRPRPADER